MLSDQLLDDRLVDDRVLEDRLVDDRVLEDRLVGDRLGDATPMVVAPMVGFGAWLAGRLVPLAQRRCVYGEVERFLAWQNTALAHDAVLHDPVMQRPAVWCYLLTRQREGCDDAEAMRLWGALELFLSYVESQHVELRST